MASYLLLMLVVALFSVGGSLRMRSDWGQWVTRNYISSVIGNLAEDAEITPDTVMGALLRTADEKVPGIILRMADGSRPVLYGAPGRSEEMGPGDFTELDMSRAKEVTKNVPLYTLEINGNGEGGYTCQMTSVTWDAEGLATVTYLIPEDINGDDIAGGVICLLDGEPICFVDILAIPVNTYGPTKFVTDFLVSALVFFVPLALLFSAVAALIFSRRSSRGIERLNAALKALARNDFTPTQIPKSTIEYAEISACVDELRDSLKRNQESRKLWIRSIAHDLNTPIASLNIMVQGAIDGVFTPDGKYFAKLKDEVDDLAARVASVKYYSDLLTPGQKVEPREIDVMSVLDEVVTECPSRSVVTLEVPEGAVAWGRRDLFRKAAGELLANAVEATGGKGPVRIAYREDGRLEVSNPGALPKPLPDFFEPWARGDQSRHSGGSGLGLPIVWQICAIHGGTASITEKDGWVVATAVFPVPSQAQDPS